MVDELKPSKDREIKAVEFQIDDKPPLEIGKEKWKIWHDVLVEIAEKKLEPELRRYQRLAAIVYVILAMFILNY